MYKLRIEESSNYKSIYINGKTMRMPIASTKPVTELNYPEFYDVKITNNCKSKVCKSYCYQCSKEEKHYDDILGKLDAMFGKMTDNQRPTSVAIGGGEPTTHPDFVQFMKNCDTLGITPNYTSNGMFVDEPNCEAILDATEKYSLGVALSLHKGNERYYEEAYKRLRELKNTKINFHAVISDKESIDRMFSSFDKHSDVDYIVLLPYETTGFAKDNQIKLEFDYLFDLLKAREDKGLDNKKFAFGANFYPYICENKKDVGHLDLSFYEPEMFSKYVDLKEDEGSVYPSSFRTDTYLCKATEIGNGWLK